MCITYMTLTSIGLLRCCTGIVRGIDTDRGLLYLVSTLPRVHLQMMNTILKGSLSLPDQILLKQVWLHHWC